MITFTLPSRHMVLGSRCRITECAGNPPWRWCIGVGVRIVIEGGGLAPTAAGIGSLIIPGVGHRFTMAAGSIIRSEVGAGVPIPFGLRHGCRGATQIPIVAGLLCRRARTIGLGLVSRIMERRLA